MAAKILLKEIPITASKELKLFVRSMAASYQFIARQEQYDLVSRAQMLDLIETQPIADLASRFAAVQDNTRLMLTRKEVYDLYQMMDIVCRSFLCEIGDDYKTIAMKANKVNEERYNEVRNTELSIAQALLQQIRTDLNDDPEFEELVERLSLLD